MSPLNSDGQNDQKSSSWSDDEHRQTDRLFKNK